MYDLGGLLLCLRKIRSFTRNLLQIQRSSANTVSNAIMRLEFGRWKPTARARRQCPGFWTGTRQGSGEVKMLVEEEGVGSRCAVGE
eukprot:755503-Hanusia_phi.AAC.2